ncbi:MAG: hypothetical protein AAF571_09475, partial [Verrucomicrobiota bacterium]
MPRVLPFRQLLAASFTSRYHGWFNYIICGLLFIVCNWTFTGCTSRPSDVDLIFINGAEPQSLDPSIVTGQIEGRLCNALFEGLTTRNKFGVAVPGVAASWQANPDN